VKKFLFDIAVHGTWASAITRIEVETRVIVLFNLLCFLFVMQPTSSRRVFTSLQSCTPFNGRLKSQIAGQTGNYEKLVVRAGSERGVRSADGGQTLDIPLLGEFQLPNFRSIRQNLSEVTPLQAAKWTTIVAVAYAAMSTVAGLTVFNANFWMYASWLGVVWPWPAAIVVGIWTLLGAIRQAKSGTKEEEQVFILGGALVWLILVPLAHVHGFVDGWPLLLYTLYYFFFSISAFVRDRMYGSLSTVPEEKRWQSSPPQVIQNAFITAIVGGHWAAAFESPFLVESWNWAWQSKLAAGLIALAVVAQWNAVYFLGKYSDRLVNPTSVVIFGPYRWVRHPMYASYILLCAGYCLALRSYFSLLFLLISCIAYYDQRTKLEEKNLVEAFGATYISYREKTKHKYLPWLY
jgi:protein-S-isoprenylcysteine O-methyltransferase Ste14